MKSNGPRIEPCGTPVEIGLYSDLIPLCSTYCDRLAR